MKCIVCGNEAVALFPRTAQIAQFRIDYGVGLCREHLDAAMKIYDAEAEPKWLDEFIKTLKEEKKDE